MTTNKNRKNLDNDQKNLKPGDLVVLSKIGKCNSMALWETWDDADCTIQEIKFWPMIIGKLKKDEVAMVLEVRVSEVGSYGVKICTPQKKIGWINCRCLKREET